MRAWVKHILPLAIHSLLLFLPEATYSQFFLYSEAPIDVSARFTRRTIEARAQSTFFNALIIKNNSNRSEYMHLNITTPQGWRVVGSERIEINLTPFDSIIVPVRISIGARVRGDIGYSIIASLTDSRGNTVRNEYCFVMIPRETDLGIRVLSRVAFIDPVTSTSDITFIIQNKGNREELVNLLLDGNGQLGVGARRQVVFSEDIAVPPYTDTTLTYPIELRETDTRGRNMFGLRVRGSSMDTVVQSTVWYRLLESRYVNPISSTDKPLVVELIGQGLVQAERLPTVSATVQGRTLLKGDSEVYYYYRNFASGQPSDFYQRTRMYLGGSVGPWRLEIGDSYRSFQSSMFGRGGYLAFNNYRLQTELAASRNSNTLSDNFGGTLGYRFSRSTRIGSGAVYNRNNLLGYHSRLAFLSSDFEIGREHRVYLVGAYNILNRELDGQQEHNEFGGELNYTSIVGQTHNSLRVKYGSPLYYGINSGRLNANATSRWAINPKHRLIFFYFENLVNRPTIRGNTIASQSETGSRSLRVEHTYLPVANTQVFWSPEAELFDLRGLPSFPAGGIFESVNYKLALGARIRTSTGSTMFSPKVEIARANVFNNPFETVVPGSMAQTAFNWQYFSMNIRGRFFNILAFYTSGPRTMIDQISWLQFNRPNRKLQFIPSVFGFLYRDIVHLNAGLSYANNIITKSANTNITGQLNFYLPNDWRINLLTVYTIQSRKNVQEVVESYQNLYIEAGVRKEFNLQHPRVKYHNLTLVFFKDFNGDGVKSPNEPGIKNVMVTATKVGSDVVGAIPSDVSTLDLLSDHLGQVFLQRIPEGLYNLTYNPIGRDAGTFSKAGDDMNINVTKSEVVYLPFVEKNKVFGKIILNRSRLSGLGRIDVSNVRITATDSQGRSFSTLTDRNGEFVIFAPVTDEYVLNINNIYYENFDLRQNNFVVHFNGFKQFEVNFVFDEKVRRINFAAAPEGEAPAGVQQVRRTSISGTVKDANSLLPIRARVNLVNTRTNTIVTSANSSPTSGAYTLTFLAGDNYLLEVLADDYWYLSENLVLNQVTTFLNVNRDILLQAITLGSKVDLNIPFNVNEAALTPEAVAELQRLLRMLRQNPNIRLKVTGHCDDLEAMQKPEVAMERAQAVARYLIENGFSNLEVESLTNTQPAASNDTPEGRAQNRRVDAEVVGR